MFIFIWVGIHECLGVGGGVVVFLLARRGKNQPGGYSGSRNLIYTISTFSTPRCYTRDREGPDQ
jgi:hypothetical protein